jgi:uncharacterized protein (TIGR03437 family)
VTPPGLAAGAADVTVTTDGAIGPAQTVTIGAAGPGIFVSPDGASAAATHANGSLVGSFTGATPARSDETITIYGTGFGATIPTPGNGEAFGEQAPLSLPADVRIGSTSVAPDYIGGTPGFTGLYHIRLRVPSLPAGNYDATVTIAGVSSPSVKLAIA